MPPSAFEYLVRIITLIIMLVGLAGVLLPFLPDLWLIWIAALVYGLLTGFDGWPGIIAMVIITLLTILGSTADVILSQTGAARGGAHWQSILVSLGLGLAGLAIYPPIGPIAGALLGLLAMEYFRNGRNINQAWRAVGGYAAGCGLSVIARMLLAVLMILVWGIWAWLGNE